MHQWQTPSYRMWLFPNVVTKCYVQMFDSRQIKYTKTNSLNQLLLGDQLAMCLCAEPTMPEKLSYLPS